MRIEFIGYTDTADWRADPDAVIDLGYIREMTAFHERLGYDSILIGYGPDSPDSLQVAAYAAAHSERIRLLVAHRAGMVFPTLAARMFATLDHVSGGRISVNLVSGGTSEGDPQREGDFLAKDERYARAGEYLQVLKAAWTADKPLSHHGTHYRFEDYPARVRPLQKPWIPLYVAGSSRAARTVAGVHADRYAFYGEPLAGTGELIRSVVEAAQACGRRALPRFTARLSVILADTDDAAWERAHRFIADSGGEADGEPGPAVSTGESRLRAAAAAGRRHDRAMWTVRARTWGATFNGLVGSPETIAAALLDYVRLGVTEFRVSGLDYLADTEAFARKVIPLVRAST